MLRYHHMLMCYGTGFQVLLPGQCNLLKRNTTCAFHEWRSKMFISSTCSPHASDSMRKRSDLSDTNISKDEGKFVSKPKLKIVHSGKPLEPFVLPMDDGSSRVKIPGIDVVVLATPILVIPIQSIVSLPQTCRHKSNRLINLTANGHDELPVKVCEPSTKKVIELPPEGAENIMDILDVEPNPTECMGVCSLDDDEVESIRRVNAPSPVPHPQCPLRSPQEEISVLNADTVIKEDLQQSYSNRTSTEEHDSCHIEVQGKLDEASRQLNTEGTHYEAKTAELKHVAASEHLLQEAEREVINLQDQIDIFNANEVMDVATKASLEKVDAYIKEPFEDLKNFQWDP
ncbi:hypothetical protein Cgig2_014339 [Carnegiea gigantea]|uniref:Uncharacterized protein n=1 Tax=Carnegiea gigantea TaxID=171969 RepID=A0A9Q1JMY0_9CARY|nr:hypothetical protein Cgig2_014339 [Carnegiea gigantea]